MAENIIETVYNELQIGTETVGKIRAEYAALEAEAKSGRYTPQVIAKEYSPKLQELRMKMRTESEQTIRKAQAHVARYREESARLNDLDAAKLTDDYRLLTSGISLNAHDLEKIIDNAPDNRTMRTLVRRYAKEHGIEIGAKYRMDDHPEERIANNLDGCIDYYSKWIGKEGDAKILDRFFTETR